MSKADWKNKPLGEVCRFVRGPFGGSLKKSCFVAEGYAVYEQQHAIYNQFNDIRYFIDKIKFQAMKRFEVSPNDLIMSCSGTMGKVAIVPDSIQPGIINQALLKLSPLIKLAPQFLKYWMESNDFQESLKAQAGGAAIQNVASVSILKQISIPLPPRMEQQRIVYILDEAFAHIATAKANAEKNLQNARAVFESHLQAVFSQRGEGWLEMPLSDLCTVKHGYAFEGEYFSNEGRYVLLTPGNFYEKGGYRDRGEKQKYYTGEIPLDYVLSHGDLLVAMTEQAAGLLGSPIIVPESDKFLHNQRLGLVIKKPGIPWTNELFFYVFNTQDVRKEIHATASGVKVRHTSPSKIGNALVRFPASIQEQRKIVSILVELEKETQRLETIYYNKISALDALKKSILHKAFSGELTASSRTQVIIPFPTKIPDISPTDLHAGILAIAYQFHESNDKLENYGHVKAEKIAHMAEAYLGIDLERNPIKDAAGPNDYPHSRKVEHRARMAGYFDFQPSEQGRYRVKKLPGFEKLILSTREKLGDRIQGVIDLMNLMVGMKTQQAEIFATVHAAWNNLLLESKPISDEAIVLEARENWHPDKMKIPREKFFAAIQWIKEKDLVPKGFGKFVAAKVG